MVKNTKLPAAVLLFVFAHLCSAEGKSILEGYGNTRWGQSLREVKELCPDGVVSSNSNVRTQKKQIRRASSTKYRSASSTKYRISGSGVVVSTDYVFQEDQLVEVFITVSLPLAPDHPQDSIGTEFVQKLVDEKHSEELEVQEALKSGQFGIEVINRNKNAQIVVDYQNKKLLAEILEKRKTRLEADRGKALSEVKSELLEAL